MKKLLIAGMLALALAACGGGGDGGGSNWNSGSENNPTATTVNAAGIAVTSISPNAPVIAKATGFLQNGIYNVALLDPSGTALYSENLTLVTDGDGNLADTILSYLGTDAGNQAAAMVVGKDEAGNTTVGIDYKAIAPGTYTAYFCKASQTTCDASTASTTSAVTVSQTTPYVYATDSAGTTGVRSFLNGSGSVYAQVMNATPGTTVGLRVIANSFQVMTNGSPIPTAVSGSVSGATCVIAANGSCPAPVLLWTSASATLSGEGAAFDVVADSNNDTLWNDGTDFMDADGYVPGFVIQDATPPAVAPDISKVVFNGTDNIADIACAQAGSAYCSYVDIFDGLDVYGMLNPRARSTNPHNLAYKYIILHTDTLADGDALTPIQSFGYNHTVDPLQWGCTNEGRILLWPKATHVPGCYDVVMDVNKNGVYNAGVDIVDGYTGHCGFIIPGVEGAPTVTINTITDGAGAVIANGGTTSSSTASFNITVALGSGNSISRCQARWAMGNSSSKTDIAVSSIGAGGTMDTQAINLFGGANTVLVTCVDDLNQAGSASATITSSNSATQNIHFQTSLNWQKTSNPSYDMDLHLIEPAGVLDGNTDCYFANCKEAIGGNPVVGAILNVDCISQCTGPENIWIPNSNALKGGRYRVCVHPFSGEGADLQVGIYDSHGGLIETVTRTLLNSTIGNWHVGDFICTAGASGACTWARSDTVGANACDFVP